jgi:hypothetical protein
MKGPVSTTITRLYGRAPQGERLVQKVLHGNWKTVTFIDGRFMPG